MIKIVIVKEEESKFHLNVLNKEINVFNFINSIKTQKLQKIILYKIFIRDTQSKLWYHQSKQTIKLEMEWEYCNDSENYLI